MTRSQQLADALIAIAKANHYMVGLVEPVTADEIADAAQILISRQNDEPNDTPWFKLLDAALDIVEHMERERLTMASRGAAPAWLKPDAN